MAKDLTLKTPDGSTILYPKTVQNLVFNNVTGRPLSEDSKDICFDISEYKSGATYANLASALGTNGANVPEGIRKGGMSIKFIHTSDNKYVQYRLMATSFSTDVSDWSFCGNDVYVDNPEWIRVVTDKDGKIVIALNKNGNVFFGAGVPQQVIDCIQQKIEEFEIEDIVYFLGDLLSGDDTMQDLLNKKVDGEYVENPDFVRVLMDKDGRIILAVEADGNIMFGAGVPRQVVEYYQEKIDELHLDGIVDVIPNLMDNSEMIHAMTDKDGKLLESTDSKGTKRFYGNVEFTNIPETIKNYSIKRSCELFVAASNAPDEIKKTADYVCTGTNDEVVINRAISDGGANAVIRLSQGTFYIDSFYQEYQSTVDNFYYAICVHWKSGVSPNVKIVGNGERGTNRTLIYVNESAWDNIPSNVQPELITKYPVYGGTLNVSNIAIRLKNNLHKICCINQQYCGGGILDHIVCTAYDANAYADHYPVEGCVAFRGYAGSDDGTIQKWQHLYVGGFYEGFQLGAEHHILLNCGGRYNYYCYTFGNYNYIQGTNDHPIILINCNDEHSACLPLFAKCGWWNLDDPNPPSWASLTEYALQSVTFVAFNIEDSAMIPSVPMVKAHENTPSSFCGRIEYTCGGAGRNSKAFTFWDSTSGKNFKTVNLTHAEGGTTTLRNTYTPNYMQQYYDEDLGKMLIYNGTNWVDSNGNIV